MMEFIDTHFNKIRILIGCILVIASLVFLSILVLSIRTYSVKFSSQAAPASPSISVAAADTYDNPNAITSGMATLATTAGQSLNTSVIVLANVNKSVAIAASQVGKTIAGATVRSAGFIGSTAVRSTKFVGTVVFRSTKFVATITVRSCTFVVRSLIMGNIFIFRGVNKGVAFVAHTPGAAIHFVAKTTSIHSVIQPAANTKVPIIVPNQTDLHEDHTALAPAEPVSQTPPLADTGADWPIHGQITTLYGVPHWPYQAWHTGIDISSGQRSGVVPVHPFKPGQVVAVERSNQGLGNHVIVDHGGGVTSVYGHMYSISVQVGQLVDKNTELGREGSTGASTGTHLHFEVRLNGQPTNPQQFVSGQP